MALNETNGSELAMEILGKSIPELMISAVDAVVVLLSLVFLVMAAIRLLRISHVPGARQILVSLAACFIGAGCLLVCSVLMDEERNPIIEALSSLYFSASMALGVHGLWRLVKAIGDVNAETLSAKDDRE